MLPAAMLFASCASRHTITANIEGLGNDTLLVEGYFFGSDGDFMDTIVVREGKFVYDLDFDASDGMADLLISPQSRLVARQGGYYSPITMTMEFVLDPGETIKITGSISDEGVRYKVRGSEFNREMAAFHSEVLQYKAGFDSLELAIYAAYDKPESDGNNAMIGRLFEERKSYSDRMNSVGKAFIRNKPANEFSAYHLMDAVSLDSLEYYMGIVSDNVLAGRFKSEIEAKYERSLEYKEYLENRKVVEEGSAAPAFTLADRNGKAVSLAGITAEYVVLDFWGSWCPPCIAGFPKMKEYYAKYLSRVEFVGIACNDKHEDWVAALDKYTPGWTQLFDDPADKVSVRYAIGAYPTKIVLGPDSGSGRKIVRIFTGEGDYFYDALDELMK